ncbi:hypothetical protein CkaCkLH20_06988 [Colletotrichum karsti]|uniref:MARVEL domain-containing protein n=1 Tax=Colletotrichum karsti TaxID=1095194 RepID=A0A9P6I276_9PEZI|nr:uncharacterized protein CkaCkLH20_06988 [Colletotrichum karsti]KAF9875607.1 hypothetical protein CkaCkLH20_06988 [Colletotrichum karsti]
MSHSIISTIETFGTQTYILTLFVVLLNTMLKFVSLGLWALQGIMAIVVLALSVELMKVRSKNDRPQDWNQYSDPPTTTKYSVFTGGFGLAVALLGAIATFFDFIPALIVVAADAVSGLLLLAGGIAIAIGIQGVTCDPTTADGSQKILDNAIINRGRYRVNDQWTSYSSEDQLLDNCKRATADQAMQFVTFGFALATMGLVYLIWKKGHAGGGRASLTYVSFYGNNGVLPFGENATQVHIGRWLTDTPVHLDALEIIAEKARRFWWGQQIDLATVSWSLLLAVEGGRRHIPSLWAYLALAHLVNLSFAQNLFYLALLLTPTPAGAESGMQPTTTFGRLRNKVFPPKPINWFPHPALFLASFCLKYVLVYWAPSTAGTSTFANIAFSSRMLTFAPLMIPAVVPISWGTVYSNHHGAYGIVVELFRFLSTASFAFHVKGTALGLLYNAPDAHYHRHSRFLPFDREERSTWERTTTALGKVLGSASDHPVVAGVAWDVLLSGASQGLWAATRALDVNDVLASSTPFALKKAPKAQPPTRLLESNDKSTPESETDDNDGALHTRHKGRSANAKSDEMTISETPMAKGNRRTRAQKAAATPDDAPEATYEPSPAESRSAVEGDELPDDDLDWESAALAWGLTALGGLGSSSAGVFGAECISR